MPVDQSFSPALRLEVQYNNFHAICTVVFVFFFSKSSSWNNAKNAFQYTFKYNATQYTHKKKQNKEQINMDLHVNIHGGSTIHFLTQGYRA